MASLFPRKIYDKNGVPVKIWYIKYTENGKIRHKSTGCRSKGEANLIFREFNPKRTASRDLNSLISEVLEYSRIYTKKKMQDQYRLTFNNFLKFTGNKPLTDITKNNIANYIQLRQGVKNKNGIHIGQELARHSNIAMTAKYYHSKRDEIKAKAMGMEL